MLAQGEALSPFVKHEIQRASSLANVEFTHNKISVSEDAEMATPGPHKHELCWL